jgi:hypothetical protein
MMTLAIPATLIALAIVLVCIGPGRIMTAGAALWGWLSVRHRPPWLHARDDHSRSSHRPR